LDFGREGKLKRIIQEEEGEKVNEDFVVAIKHVLRTRNV
jgi:hypothetical protein